MITSILLVLFSSFVVDVLAVFRSPCSVFNTILPFVVVCYTLFADSLITDISLKQ